MKSRTVLTKAVWLHDDDEFGTAWESISWHLIIEKGAECVDRYLHHISCGPTAYWKAHTLDDIEPSGDTCLECGYRMDPCDEFCPNPSGLCDASCEHLGDERELVLSRCTHVAGSPPNATRDCNEPATCRIHAPDGEPVPGGFLCRKHGHEIAREYRTKLGERWTIRLTRSEFNDRERGVIA